MVSPPVAEGKIKKKRGKVPTSCSECRRLKLRCDKQVPCGKCVSRGCGSVCPDGLLKLKGTGHRLVLAKTEELHDRIDTLCARIQDLETALRSLQKEVSSEPHPLLSHDLLQLKAPQGFQWVEGSSSAPQQSDKASSVQNSSSPVEKSHESVVDAFGTLSIGPGGETCFLGPTARCEYLIRALEKPQDSSMLHVFPQRISHHIIDICHPPEESIGREIFSLLPPLAEALELSEIYLEFGRFMYCPTSREQLFEVIIPSVYRAQSFKSVGQHLPMLMMVFALGCMFDKSRPPFCAEGKEYYYMARAAMKLSPNEHATLSNIHATVHMAQYQHYSDCDLVGSDSAWFTIGDAVRLAISMGLHMNPERFQLTGYDKDYRNHLFWFILACDTWLSFNHGRPPSFSPGFLECSPLDPDQLTRYHSNGCPEAEFHMWTFRYATLLHNVMSTTFGTTPPNYAVIIDLDSKIRNFPVPPELQCSERMYQPGCPKKNIEQPLRILGAKEATLLNLHRGYFAQALHEKPNDLPNHPYFMSVLAAYRSAWRIMRCLSFTWEKSSDVCVRVNDGCSAALSAAIVMCILVIRAPSSKMTRGALDELDTLMELFIKAAPTCRNAANNIDTIRKLRTKAFEVSNPMVPQPDTLPLSEVDRLSGRTHFVSAQPGGGVLLNQESLSSQFLTMHPHPILAHDMVNYDLHNQVPYDHSDMFDPQTTDMADMDYSFEGQIYELDLDQPLLGQIRGGRTL
ncbi:hypothetical protein C8J56DRAFT_1095331 [Mycena floridula]|nr:hypothetical protein C8J56DRAFT_1095331 [Mycena floridula]